MGRRDRDPRPAIEVVGADRPDEPAQRVEVGRRRSSGGRGRGLVALLAVAAVLLVGVALSDEGDDEPGGTEEQADDQRADGAERAAARTTSTSTSSSTASTTTTLPTGPVLSERTGMSLLLLAGTNATHLDLDTGTRHELRLPGTDGWRLVGVSGGVVTIDDRRAVYVPLPSGEPRIELGPAENVLSAGSPDRVWLLSGLGLERSESQQTAVLVDLTGDALTGHIPVPSCCPLIGVEDGILFSAAGRTYLATEDGVRLFASHPVVSATGSHVVELVCDDVAICAPEVVDRATGTRIRLDPVHGAVSYAVFAAVSPDGEVAVMERDGPRPSMVVYDAAGHQVGTVEDLVLYGAPVWLPGDHGLVVASSAFGVHLIRLQGGSVDVEPIAALERDRGERVVVIPPRGCCDGPCLSPCGAAGP